jgi:hypothetical protein
LGGSVVGLDHDTVIGTLGREDLTAIVELPQRDDRLTALREDEADAVFQVAPTRKCRRWLTFSKPFRYAQVRMSAALRPTCGPAPHGHFTN